jgi:hypothetical protein
MGLVGGGGFGWHGVRLGKGPPTAGSPGWLLDGGPCGGVGVGARVVELHGGGQRLVAGGPGAVVVAGAGHIGRGADSDIEAGALGEGVAAHGATGQGKAGSGHLQKAGTEAGNHKKGS